MKLSFHTSQQVSPGYTSLQLGIAYTDGVVDEEEVSRAIQLGIDAVIQHLSQSVIRSSSSRQIQRQDRANQEGTQGDSLDQILEQILCEGVNLSAV